MLLEMTGICKDYMQGKMAVRVLTDVALQVKEGDYLAIMGPSGSGKTTLMNLIGCLDVPTKGSYLLDGEDIGKLKSNKLAQVRNEVIGFVFQSFYLLPKLSALDNVALPLLYAGVPKAERRTRAKEALEKMGLGDRLQSRPNQLSGGQCQRVAIARAIVTKPKLLLADEPTGALDSASGKQIMDIFDELNESGVTIIMITHEQEVAARAKRICHIRDGVLTGGMPDYELSNEEDGALPIEEETDSSQDSAELLAKVAELTGHNTDLMELVQDVFGSPEEEEDVFSSPEKEDVFAMSEKKDVFSSSGERLVFAIPEKGDVFAESEDADIPINFEMPEVGDVFSDDTGEES